MNKDINWQTKKAEALSYFGLIYAPEEIRTPNLLILRKTRYRKICLFINLLQNYL